MPTPVTPTTLLDAVNTLLVGIRVSPIDTLTLADENEDSLGALKAINDVNREIQNRGWYWNTNLEQVIDPEVNGEVLLPANTLKVKTARTGLGTRLTQRGGKLWDPKRASHVIEDVVEVDIVVCLDFDDLPMAAKTYVTGVAARKFCLPKLPARTTFQWTEELVMAALSELEQEDTEQQDSTLDETSPHFAKHKRGKR